MLQGDTIVFQNEPEDRILIVTDFPPQNPFVEALIDKIATPVELCFLDIAGKRAGNLFIRHVMTLWLAGVVLIKSRHFRKIIMCKQFIGLYYCLLARLFSFIKSCFEALLISLSTGRG